MKEKWNDFEHQLWALLKNHNLDQAPAYLLALSGGLDSMVLLEVLQRIRPQSQIRVAHFHHGPGSTAQIQYRDQALDFVKHKISNNQDFVLGKSEKLLKSEAEMREARWNFLRRERKANEAIVTAHHLDDWTETALLKMMRGTSLEGISNLKVWNSEIFRPFLRNTKAELLNYAKSRNVEWVEDPSNQSDDYLRNWLRETWLKDLEAKKEGAYANLSKSLLQIVDDYHATSTFSLVYFDSIEEKGLDRAWFLGLSSSDQIKAIALYLKKRHIYEFTQGQLKEIIKRLDKNQKDITFILFERKWVINASQIMLE